MLNKVISADTIDGAVDKVLDELKEDARSGDRHHVIYFDGWDGLGASAVLRAVSRRLTQEGGSRALAAAGLEFSHIFHIDCSKWESRRTMQRMVAQQLKLPPSVMEMFDAQDEEDGYQGISKDSRVEIPQIAVEINRHILKLDRFLLIFHNGSREEVDLSSFGFPMLDQYSRNKVLWSFQGRFRTYPRTKVDEALKNTRTTDIFLSADSSDIGEDRFSHILHHEAKEVACEMTNLGGIDWSAAATNCFVYVMNLCRMSNDVTTDYDLATHVCNYWICDGIIHRQQGDVGADDGAVKLWLSTDALHCEMRLDVDKFQNPYFPSLVEKRVLKHMPFWISPTYGFIRIPDGHIPRGMFQQFDKLYVLKLSACEFSFRSPPFLCCHNLRFLWLDHCREGSNTTEVVEEDAHQVLQRLWVLDVRYSNGAFLSQGLMNFMTLLRELNIIGEEDVFDMDLLRRQLCNIRKLRIAKSQMLDENTTISGMNKLELLEFSENTSVENLYVENCINLESVIIYGSTALEIVSLTGCTKVKNLYLSGSLPSLKFIGIAGAVVEILDLRGVTYPDLIVLYLLECEKLCAILWPSSAEGKTKILGCLIIDTKQKKDITADTSTPSSGPDYWKIVDKKVKFNWHISIRDARILWSLEPVKDYFGSNDAHLEVSTILPPTLPSFDATGTKDGRVRSSGQHNVQVELKQPHKDTTTYKDVDVTLKEISTRKQEEDANEDDSGSATGIMWPCPPYVPTEDCYIHIEDLTNRTKSKIASITLPGFICDGAKIMHVHDNLHITSIVAALIASATWNKLEWCRVERCPKLGCIFSPQLGGPEGSNMHTDMFKKLTTTWVSHLPKARYIWKWSGTSESWYYGETFKNLTLLHIEYCPRMIHIISYPVVRYAFDRLEILEIMWCGDLSVAFKFYDTPESSTWGLLARAFLKLKQIRLHELPNLHYICNVYPWISMPELETIKIRGCWSLKRLPTVESQNVVECDCEKEWWDRLKWESVRHRSCYKPIHPRYYKKTMLRGSVLR